MIFRQTLAEINLQKLRSNFQKYKKLNLPFLCPMVKGNAYGHGDEEVAKTLRQEGAQYLGVGLLEEAIRLRAMGDEGAILNFAGVNSLEEMQLMQDSEITPVVSSDEQLSVILENKGHLPVHLKFNTGMNRLGFSIEQAEKIFSKVKDKLKIQGICTHLAKAEDLKNQEGFSRQQLQDFLKVRKLFANSVAHIWSSAALENLVDGDQNIGGRPGIGIYQDVMKLKTEIVQIHHLKKNEAVSYNLTWKAERPSQIATLSIGYADGLRRILSQKNQMVLCQRKKVPIVGTVCMDYTMIDVTSIAKVNIGDEVVIFGEQGGEKIIADDVAKNAETISYEIFTGISERVPRMYA